MNDDHLLFDKTDQSERQRFLAKHGINAKAQQMTTHTIQQMQEVIVVKVDRTGVEYLRRWIPELRGMDAKLIPQWLRDNKCNYQAVSRDEDPIMGWKIMTYVLFRKEPEIRKAIKIRFRVMPILEGRQKGDVRLDMDAHEIPFPSDVKIVEAA
jgi:hypothetical protein